MTIIRFIIPIVFLIKLDWNVCICLTQLYDGRDMYRIYYIKNNYMFWHFTRSVRKVSDRIFLCEHLMDYNLARLHEPTLNLSAHA